MTDRTAFMLEIGESASIAFSSVEVDDQGFAWLQGDALLIAERVHASELLISVRRVALNDNRAGSIYELSLPEGWRLPLSGKAHAKYAAYRMDWLPATIAADTQNESDESR